MMKELLLLLLAASCCGFQPPVPTTSVNRRHHNSSFSPQRKATATTQLNAAASTGLDAFDYKTQWYPVIWSRDVPLNQPTRVTLFDVNYVVAKTSSGMQEKHHENSEEVTYVAMLDECPHKKVALSEGRITECGGFIQCSYHGWTFDGTDGKCIEIPQTVIAAAAATQQQGDEKGGGAASSDNNMMKRNKRREDGTAIAITEAQGMLWISPFLSPLEALAATSEGRLSPPPRVPEIDMAGYKTQIAIRDFPIDWTVLMENIMDPDHGYFAHSSSGTAPIGFDWYSSDGVDNIMDVKEEMLENGGWKIASSVNAVGKLARYNREVRSFDGTIAKDNSSKRKNKNKTDEAPPKLATTTFVAPSLIYMGRRDNTTATSNFLTAFWVCPVGTGRSRFMSAAVSKAPFTIPRWIVHIQLNNFLDQDTFLLLGQHRAVLKKEAEGHLENDSAATAITTTNNNVRKSTYVYRSPSEKLPVKIGQYFDATLSRVPNRKESLMAWYNRNNYENKLFEPWPNRENVLDRYEQHTKICPDSKDVVNRCDRVMKRSKAVGWALILLKLVVKPQSAVTAATAKATGLLELGSFALGFRSVVSTLSTALCSLVNSFAHRLIQTKPFFGILAALFVSHYIAARIKREFFFKFDDKIHHEDIQYIANNWKDL
jgi:phenylpropionate dioxygenase-like ring-hydroxylating dioxygenase large terminal subunit